jgi:hypothetical protein
VSLLVHRRGKGSLILMQGFVIQFVTFSKNSSVEASCSRQAARDTEEESKCGDFHISRGYVGRSFCSGL